jgi:hypothetical protein
MVVVLVVAGNIVLAAVQYFMVLGFDNDPAHGDPAQTPTAQMQKSSTSTGWRFTVAGITRDTQWGDVRPLLQNGTTTDSWTLTTHGLTGSAGQTYNGGQQLIGGSTSVYLNVTDLVGNGFVNAGDYISLEPGIALSPSCAYTMTLIYLPTGMEITHVTFEG